MDSGYVDCGGGGFTNGGYSNPIESTPQTMTNPGFDLTFSNLPTESSPTNYLTNSGVSPECASQQNVNLCIDSTQQHSAQHTMVQNHKTVSGPINDQRPPAHNPNDAPSSFPPAYSPSVMYTMQSSQYPGQPVYPQHYPQQYPHQHQNQQVTVVGMQQTTPNYVVQPTPYQSYGGHIALACVTFWCCGVLFGIIAFILAVTAENRRMVDSASARQYGRASIGVSIAGIVIGVVIYIAIGIAVGTASASTRCYGYTYYSSRCY